MSIVKSIVAQCLAQIETVRKGYTTDCPYCGALSIDVFESETICNFCEAYLPKRRELALSPGSNKMRILNAEAITGNTVGLDAFAEELKKQDLNPLALYGLANLYWVASWAKYLELDYNLEGFMEQNSNNVYASMAYTSKAKEYFYKAVYAIEHVEQTENVTQLLYTKVMCNIKLGRVLQAWGGLEELNRVNTDELARSYANMAYVVAVRDPNALQFIRPLLNAGEIGSIYYLARMLAQKKEFSDASLILGTLSASFNMPMCGYLLRSINELMEKTAP